MYLTYRLSIALPLLYSSHVFMPTGRQAMLNKPSRLLIVLAFVLLSQMANAFVDPPTLAPASPTESQTISVNIRVGQCDALGEMPGYPQITQTANAIRILLDSYHAFFAEYCNIIVGVRTFPLGTYPAGSYTVQVDRTYEAILPTRTIVETLGILPFTVAGSPAPAVLPTTGSIALLALFMSILLIAAPALSRRQLHRNTFHP
jgi:hypothetical protein